MFILLVKVLLLSSLEANKQKYNTVRPVHNPIGASQKDAP